VTMLSATFLGWQGWLLATGTTHLLVDPLLDDRIGRGPRSTRQTFFVWPPRRFEASACPPIDALVLSHEHEDHFNLSSLVQLDRRIPVLLSARASTAASVILAEMGFQVRRVYPGAPTRVGDVELTFFTPDHRHQGPTDEWDTLGYLFRHVDGHGAFFSNVDISFTAAMQAAVAAVEGEVLVYEAMSLGVFHDRFVHAEASEMHRSAQADFREDIAGALRDRARVRPFPGQTVILRDGRVAEAAARTAWLSAPPRAEWGAQPPFWRRPGEPPVPLTPPRDLDDDELAELALGLERIAEHLYGGDIFRRLHSLTAPELDGHTPTMAWLLRTRDEETVLAYAYRPEACGFFPLDEITRDHAGVVIAWATDVLALLRGEIEPRCIVRGWSEIWIPALSGASFLVTELWPFFHPLRHPGRVLARYRNALAEEPARELLFRAPAASR
jgi:Beta-lactamase superfamily domain